MKSNIQTCLVVSIYCLWIDEFHAFCHVNQPGATKINMVNLARSGLVTQVSISLEVFLGDFHFRAKSKYSWNSRPIDPLACWQKVEIIPMLECWVEREMISLQLLQSSISFKDFQGHFEGGVGCTFETGVYMAPSRKTASLQTPGDAHTYKFIVVQRSGGLTGTLSKSYPTNKARSGGQNQRKYDRSLINASDLGRIWESNDTPRVARSE